MPISELGYRHWNGRRTHWLSRSLAIARSEIGVAYKSSKLLRRFMIFAWMPILYFCPFFLAIGYAMDPTNSLEEGGILTEIVTEVFPRQTLEMMRENPEVALPAIWSLAFYYFFAYTQSFFSMIVVAIVGPPLIAKDMKSKAFLVYFSKPIRPWQYLLGKLTTVMFFVFSMTLFPALLLYAVGVGLSPSPGALLATLPTIFKIALSSILTAAPIGLIVLLMSSFTKDRKIATFLWVATWLFGEIAFRVLMFGGQLSSEVQPPRWAGLLSIREMTTRATSGIFEVRESLYQLLTTFQDPDGRFEHMLRGIASDSGDVHFADNPHSADILNIAGSGYPPSVSIAGLLIISVICGWIVQRRAKGQVRI